jgi:UDP-N-acetylmuramate-alanine ligase
MPPANRRSSLPTVARWRARCVLPARSNRSSSRQVGDLPQAILDAARDGDVVMTMGAGSIGGSRQAGGLARMNTMDVK